MNTSETMPKIADDPEQRVKDIEPVISEIIETMTAEITKGAKEAGWNDRQAKQLAKDAQPPFFDLLLQGAPAPLALMEAVAYADRTVAASVFNQAIKDGSTPNQAFAIIKEMKTKAGAGGEIAASAEAAFEKALSDGETPEEALFYAFDAAADTVNNTPVS